MHPTSDKALRVVLWFSVATAVAMAASSWFLAEYFAQTCEAALPGRIVPRSFGMMNVLVSSAWIWAVLGIGFCVFARPASRVLLTLVSIAGNVACLALFVIVAAWCALDHDGIRRQPPAFQAAELNAPGIAHDAIGGSGFLSDRPAHG
jgi:hypothetical protein